MIKDWSEIQERYDAIKDHKPRASKKLNELGDILSSAYMIDLTLNDILHDIAFDNDGCIRDKLRVFPVKYFSISDQFFQHGTIFPPPWRCRFHHFFEIISDTILSDHSVNCCLYLVLSWFYTIILPVFCIFKAMPLFVFLYFRRLGRIYGNC